MVPCVAVLLALAASASAEPYYETRDLRMAARGYSRDDMRPALMTELRRLGLVPYRQRDDGRLVKTTVLGFGVTADAMAAGLLLTTHGAVGAEYDVMVGVTAGKGIRPVTVRWEPDRMVFVEGEPMEYVGLATADPRDVLARYRIGPLETGEGRVWDELTSGLLLEALGTLSDGELSRIEDLKFRRVAAPSAGADPQLAAYTLAYGHPTVEVYDDALSPRPRFVGEPSAPRPWALYVLLHEIGHALSRSYDIRAEAAVREALGRLPADASRRAAGQRAIDRSRPAVSVAAEALEAATGARRPPTLYARTGPEESFAECFALFHTDRSALERVSPEAVAFFDEGRHLAALDDAWASLLTALADLPPQSP